MSADIKMMEDQIEGMVTKGKKLRADEALFLKALGIDEETEKTRQDRDADSGKVETLKAEIKDLKKKKQNSLKGVAAAISKKMGEVLPVGDAVFSVDNGVFFGWNYAGKKIPYDGLSGGQAQIFNSALAHALQANILVIEAGELDDDHLGSTLEELAKVGSQIIVNTCHPLQKVAPQPFKPVVFGG
ncbi:MAG: hypothetical protein GY737_14000 [Desulfobacteraceae bacterium]|nr:hypothetical protein [Desulfobacteraceae bacterium]